MKIAIASIFITDSVQFNSKSISNSLFVWKAFTQDSKAFETVLIFLKIQLSDDRKRRTLEKINIKLSDPNGSLPPVGSVHRNGQKNVILYVKLSNLFRNHSNILESHSIRFDKNDEKIYEIFERDSKRQHLN